MFTGILAALVFQFGISANQPIHSESVIDYSEEAAIHFQIGSDEKPFYLWSSAAVGDTKILGQKISKTYNFGVGLGYKFNFSEIFYAFVDAGVGYPHNVTNYEIQQEVAYTYLVDRHAVENRPIPVDVLAPYDQDSYATTWDVDYGVIVRTGFGFKSSERTRINIGYKYFNPRGLIEIYDEERRAAGGGWWQEYVTINMNVIEASFMITF